MESVSQRLAGIASATTNTFREIGGSFGIAVLGAYINVVARHTFDARLLGSVPADMYPLIVGHYQPLGAAPSKAALARIPPDLLAQLKNKATASLTHGIGRAIFVSALTAFAAAVISVLFVRTSKNPSAVSRVE